MLTEKGLKKLGDVHPGQLTLQSSMFDDVLNEAEKKQLQVLMRKLKKRSMEKTNRKGIIFSDHII